MKVQGSANPEAIWIKEGKNGIVTVLLRKNVTTKTNEYGDTIYEYDEVEVELADRANLIDYIQNNFDLIFNEGLAKEGLPPEPTIEERISALENALLNLI